MTSERKHKVVVAENLTIGYSTRKRALVISEDLNFSINEGELVALVGANGVGKSTLLRTMAGIQPPLAGEIILNNRSLSHYNTMELAQQLSVVLTEAPASKNLTVLELISLGRQPYTNWMGRLSSEDRDAITHALTVTETEHLAHRKCFELSDGQLQRVTIARALAQDTPVILLDEPTTHLDIYHRAYVLKLLKKLSHEAGKAIFFSTHEIDLAIQLSDKMLILSEEKNHFDTPAALIDSGYFETLFPKDTIDFDPKTKRFTIKK